MRMKMRKHGLGVDKNEYTWKECHNRDWRKKNFYRLTFITFKCIHLRLTVNI